MKAKEVKQARERGINPVEHIIARDGIAIVVHPDNPISGLTLDQLKAIYSGDISRWNDLGIQKGQIVVVSRDVTSGTFEVFNEKVLKGARLREDALMQASNLEVATTVAKTPGAIGYVGLGYLSDEVKALKIDGIEPTEETVRSGRYPLARPLYMYTNGEPKGLAARFIQFVLSPDGQKIAKDQGFVPLK
jgi:phosphate transport system substrate-binding protein